jgi:hypothetical protein
MSKKPLLITASLAAGLVLYTNCLLAQNTSSPPPSSPAPAAKPAPKVDLSKLPPASDKKGLTFDQDILPMVKASCANCHGATKPRDGFSVLTATSILKDAKGRSMVVPGKSTKSNIVLYTAGLIPRREMPPLEDRDTNPALTAEQIGILRAWIDQGAK